MGIFDAIRNALPAQALQKSGGSVLGIDIGSSSIKVVQLRREHGAAVLETYGELALGPYANVETGRATHLAPEKLAEALKDIMREANVTTKVCGVSIPFSSSLISLIDMPILDPNQLAKMIPIEARKYIPVPITEVQLDWFILPEDESHYVSDEGTEPVPGTTQKEPTAPTHSRVLLVAIHNEVLTRYADVLKDVQLKPSFYEIEIFSTIRATLDRGIAPVAILDIGAAVTKLYIVEYGIVRISHVINRGGQDITLALSKSLGVPVAKAEELKRQTGLLGENAEGDAKRISETGILGMEFILSEAKRAIVSYEKKYARNLSKVVLTGGGALIEGALPFAKKHLEVDILLGDPFGKLQAPAFLEDILKAVGPDFTVAVGLALRKLQEQG
jgi:type IV pilus assembly protein PilM